MCVVGSDKVVASGSLLFKDNVSVGSSTNLATQARVFLFGSFGVMRTLYLGMVYYPTSTGQYLGLHCATHTLKDMLLRTSTLNACQF